MTLDERVREIVREELQASGIQVYNPTAQAAPPVATPPGMQAPAPQFAPPPGPPMGMPQATPPGPPATQMPTMPGPGGPPTHMPTMPGPGAPVPPATGAPGTPAATVTSIASLDDIKAKCNDLARANQENAPRIVAVLAKHQATTLDQLQPASYAQVMTDLNALEG